VNLAACDQGEVPAGAFAASGGRWTYAGALTFDNAAQVFEAASVLPLPASGVIDLAGLARADSVALAVLLALKRRGMDESRPLVFEALPANLESLARVYGIDELLQAGPGPAA